MMRKGRRSAAVCLAVAVIFACYLAQTIDCYRLKKTESIQGRKDPRVAETAVQEGRIIFGGSLAKRSVLESLVKEGTTKTFSKDSEEDDAAYQADSPGQDPMDLSLKCGGDGMRFSAEGRGALQFPLKPGHAPLSQVPTCGYTIQKKPHALAMFFPYKGCNMAQKDGNYMLPMCWQGTPLSLLCPATAATHHLPQYPWDPHVPQHSQTPFLPPSHFYHYFQYMNSHPTPHTTIPPPADPTLPPKHHYPIHPFYPYPPYMFPFNADPTVKPTTTKHPPQHPYIHYFPFMNHFVAQNKVMPTIPTAAAPKMDPPQSAVNPWLQLPWFPPKQSH